MQFKSYKTYYLTAAVGCLIFILLSIIAMFFYPGGNYIDTNTVGYAFHLNYLSDLGRTVARNGVPNPIASILFPIAVIISGTLVPVYFYAIRSMFKDTKQLKLVNIGFVLSIIAAAFYIGVALAPVNLYYEIHNAVMFIAFFSTILAIAFIIPTMFRNPIFPKIYTWLYILVEILVFLHIGILIFSWDTNTLTELAWQCLTQKFAIYGEMIVIILQSSGAIKIEKDQKKSDKKTIPD